MLKLAALSSASPLLSGCWPFTRNPKSPCQFPPPSLQGPLTIDAHCHIFNGSDLEVKDFFTKVFWNEKGILGVVSDAVGAILEDLVWLGAPTGDQELALLSKFEACLNDTQKSSLIKQHHDAQYDTGRNALLQTRALSGAPQGSTRMLSQPLSAMATIGRNDVLAEMRAQLQGQTRDEYKTARDQTLSVRSAPNIALSAAANVSISIAGTLDYVLENFQYRYGAFQDYLSAYGNTDGRNVDLMLASMVDYDWWLSQGCPPVTNLQKQVQVMAKMSIVTRGQVHGFVPFDPLREVAFYAGKQPEKACSRYAAAFSSLDLVKDAIQNRGCLGVKLYPPMGFSAYGNADRPATFWDRDWLPKWMLQPVPSTKDNRLLPIGQRLDDALAFLYTWCSDNDVPVMAHSDASNGVVQEFKDLAGPQYWSKVLAADRWPNLRISFGHLGGFSDQSPAPRSAAEQFIALMGQTGPGSNAHADSAYFSEVLDANGSLKAEIIKQYQAAPVLPNRLMYGTDWNLLINFGQIKPYLADFISIFNDVDKTIGSNASGRFFGSNAAEWIGLKQGMPARKRVTDFYKKNGLNPDRNPPDWMKKVDA